jgi:hypothetical protein
MVPPVAVLTGVSQFCPHIKIRRAKAGGVALAVPTSPFPPQPAVALAVPPFNWLAAWTLPPPCNQAAEPMPW